MVLVAAGAWCAALPSRADDGSSAGATSPPPALSRLEADVRGEVGSAPGVVDTLGVKALRGAIVEGHGDGSVTGDSGSPLAAPPGNDACAAATPINGTGTFAFNNIEATTDGPSHPACIDPVVAPGEGGIARDVWYCWTASCSGAVRVDTCGLTTVDTRVAVYNGCTCPGTDARILACDDDSAIFRPRASRAFVTA